MITVQSFTFNPFYENTYVLYDESDECVIIDPGCMEKGEQQELQHFIHEKNLRPVRLLNTHTHIDHVFGNHFVASTWSLGLEIHEMDQPILAALPQTAELYGFVQMEPSPQPSNFLDETNIVEFGNSKLDILHVPGHSPGHLAFVDHEQQQVIQGDVLFLGSIGRTDLPGGDFDTLISSIKNKLFPLSDGYKVYTGHGPQTTIGSEKQNNPFLQN